MTQEHSTSKQEFSEIESLVFAYKMGENGGFYKVQLINEFGVVWAGKVLVGLVMVSKPF